MGKYARKGGSLSVVLVRTTSLYHVGEGIQAKKGSAETAESFPGESPLGCSHALLLADPFRHKSARPVSPKNGRRATSSTTATDAIVLEPLSPQTELDAARSNRNRRQEAVGGVDGRERRKEIPKTVIQ